MHSSRVITELLFMWKLHKHCYLIHDSLPCLPFFAPKFSIFNYKHNFPAFFSACKLSKICILIATWITEYFCQRFKFVSQKASSKCKQQYLMSIEMPEKNVMCKEAFLHMAFPLFRLLGMMSLCYDWYCVWFWTQWVGHCKILKMMACLVI